MLAKIIYRSVGGVMIGVDNIDYRLIFASEHNVSLAYLDYRSRFSPMRTGGKFCNKKIVHIVSPQGTTGIQEKLHQ